MDEETGYRQWSHPAPRAVFLLVHGLGAHNGRWEALADFLLNKGISSYAIASRSPENFYRDILRLYEIASKDNPGKDIFLAGESLGAVISFLLAIDRPELFAGLVCFSPAFRSRLKLPLSDYLNIFTSLFYNPKKTFKVPFDSSMCTRDPDYRKKMDSDARESRIASSRSLVGTILSQVRANLLKGRLKIPVLFLVALDDKIVYPEASIEVFKNLKVEDKTLFKYPGMYHSLSVELGKEKVFEDLLSWAEKRI